MTFGSNNQFEGVSTSKFSGLTFTADTDRALGIAEESGLDITGLLENSGRSLVSEAGRQHRTLQNKARRYIRDFSAPFSQSEEDDLILELLEMLASPNVWSEKGSDKNRHRAVKQASDYMTAHLSENLSINRICAEVNTPACTLRRVFYETYGVGPKHYYLRARLSKARSRLLKRKNRQTVSDAANEMGFWHLGQFAKDYRTFFGELPTQTLTSV